MKKVATFFLVSMLMFSSFMYAEDVSSEVVYNQGDVSLEAGVDYLTKFFFRGILQEDDDYIIQPYATIYFHIVSGCDVEVSLFSGVFASIHGEDVTQGLDDPESVNVLLFYGGVQFDLYDLLTVKTAFNIYTSPNGGAGNANGLNLRGEDIYEISVHAQINDQAITGNKNFGINPYVFFAYELHDSNPNVNNQSDEAAFILTGINPTISFEISNDASMSISLPVTVGFGANNSAYVDENGLADTYGYTSVGLYASIPLFFIPKRLGIWSIRAGADAFFLGGAAKDQNREGDNADNNGGEEFDIAAKFGLHITY